MMYAGLAGSGILGVILGRSNSLQSNSVFTDLFIPPIVILTGMLSKGVISGSPGVNHDILTEASYNSAKPPPWGVMPFNIIYLTTLTKK